jgi:hypothetical protein
MRRVLENKRDHKRNKTVEKRAEAAERKAKAKGKQPVTGKKKGDRAPSTVTGASDTQGKFYSILYLHFIDSCLANGAGPSNSERTATPGPPSKHHEPNEDEDDVNSDKEVERHEVPSRLKARPKVCV